jgi:hypothetical protein
MGGRLKVGDDLKALLPSRKGGLARRGFFRDVAKKISAEAVKGQAASGWR